MTRLWPQGEAIHLILDAAQRPLRFTWRGQSHPIRAIHQDWQVDTDWWSEDGHIYRHYFAVTTESGLLCVIYYDWIEGTWRLAKVYD